MTVNEQATWFDYSEVDDRLSQPPENLKSLVEEIREKAKEEAREDAEKSAMLKMRRHWEGCLLDILASPTPHCRAIVWLIVINSRSLEGVSMDGLANKADGRSRQDISKMARDICEKFQIPPSERMRSLDAVDAYKKRQERKISECAKSNT